MAVKPDKPPFPCPRCGKPGPGKGYKNSRMSGIVWRLAQMAGFYRNGQVYVADLCKRCYYVIDKAFKGAK